MTSSHIILAVVVACIFSAATPALAQDVWTSPNSGVTHLHRTTVAPAEFHALIVDLHHPGVRIRTTPQSERWKTTSQYAIDAKLAGAINAGPWFLISQRAKGLAVSDGEIWSVDDEQLGFFAVDAKGVASIVAPREPRPSLRNISEGVAGIPLLVDAGRVTPQILQLKSGRDARAAVGVSKDGNTVILVTADGRQASSVGASLDEVGQLMIELGAERAINLDGGNSTTMFIAHEGGVVNHPSRGWERETITHIGVQAPVSTLPATNPLNIEKRDIQGIDNKNGGPAISIRVTETPEAVQELAARSIPQAQRGTRGRLSSIWLLDRIFVGQARELLAPGFAIICPLALILWLAFWLRRARRARNINL